MELDAAITSVTYSDDPAAALAAVITLGPNTESIARLEVYRDPNGLVTAAVAYDAEGRPSVLTFDAQGRPARMDSAGYVLAITYSGSAMDVQITSPDGTIQRTGTQLAAASIAPPRDAVNARLAADTAPDGMALYDGRFTTAGLVTIETRDAEGAFVSEARVRYAGESCGAGNPRITCTATLRDAGREPSSGSVIELTATVRAGDTPGAPTAMWRTRGDCEQYNGKISLGQTVIASAAAAVAFLRGWSATPAGLSAPGAASRMRLAAVIFATVFLAQRVGLGALKVDCGSVPNLETLRDKVLDAVAGETVTVSAGAHPTHGCPGRDAILIRKGVETASVLAFLPANRGVPSAPGTVPFGRELGSITFRARECGSMAGEFDFAAMATKNTSLSMLQRVVTGNTVGITYAQESPESVAQITGTFAVTLTLPDDLMYAIHAGVGSSLTGSSAPPMPPAWVGCTSIIEVQGDIRGAQREAGSAAHAGKATITLTTTIRGCERTGANIRAEPPQTLRGVPWTATGNDVRLRGSLVMSATSGSAASTWIFEVRRE